MPSAILSLPKPRKEVRHDPDLCCPFASDVEPPAGRGRGAGSDPDPRQSQEPVPQPGFAGLTGLLDETMPGQRDQQPARRCLIEISHPRQFAEPDLGLLGRELVQNGKRFIDCLHMQTLLIARDG